VDRAVTALAVGVAAGAAAVIVWSGGLAVRVSPAADDRAPREDGPVEAGDPPPPDADDAAATRGGGDPR
jgi:hypothetical protein